MTELSEVSRRFVESEQVLREAKERLTSIIESEQRSSDLAGNLSEAVRTVQEFAVQAGEVLAATQDAVTSARSVLEAGSQIIDGSTLSDIRDHVAAIQAESSKFAASQAALQALVERGQAALHDAIKEELSRLAAAQAELQTLIESGQVDGLRRIDGNRRILLFSAGVLLAAQVVVGVLVALT